MKTLKEIYLRIFAISSDLLQKLWSKFFFRHTHAYADAVLLFSLRALRRRKEEEEEILAYAIRNA